MNAQTLPQLLDAALNERNVTPEKHAEYHDRLNKLSLLLLADYWRVKEEAKAWAEAKERRDANPRLIAACPELLELVLAFERWEGDLIMDSEAWRYDDGEPRELPKITGDLWDRLLELQRKRNEVLEKAGLSFEARAEAKERIQEDESLPPWGNPDRWLDA